MADILSNLWNCPQVNVTHDLTDDIHSGDDLVPPGNNFNKPLHESILIKSYDTVSALWGQWVNTLRLRENGRHFADDIFKCIFVNENLLIPIKKSLKFVPKGPIKNIPALVQIMAWRWSGDKPLSEPIMVSLPTHICVTRPQWVNVWGVVWYHVVSLVIVISGGSRYDLIANMLQWHLMSVMGSRITGNSTDCSTVCSGMHKKKWQSSMLLACLRGTTGIGWISHTKLQ